MSSIKNAVGGILLLGRMNFMFGELLSELMTVYFADVQLLWKSGIAPCTQNISDIWKLQEGRSVNARLYIAAFSHILETSIIFHRFRYMMPHQCNLSEYIYSYFDIARSVAIKKPYSLLQSALVGVQNGIWILGLYHFVLEEFDHNVANYISS